MANNMARALATYQEVEVTSRSPLELVVMLYDGALGALRQAHDALVRRDLVTKRDAMRKALEILQHLQNSLNMDEGGEVAANLDGLYRLVVSRVIDANLNGDPAPLDEAIRVLATVREAWGQIAAAPEPAQPASSATGTFGR
jgi:flagellar protein FliS